MGTTQQQQQQQQLGEPAAAGGWVQAALGWALRALGLALQQLAPTAVATLQARVLPALAGVLASRVSDSTRAAALQVCMPCTCLFFCQMRPKPRPGSQ